MRLLTIIVLILVLLVPALLLGGGYFVLRLLAPPTVTTDVNQYDAIFSQWQPRRLVDHFPPTIPQTAANVRLSYIPGYLQGGAHFQVRMELPPAAVAAIKAQAGQATTHQYQGGSFYEHYNDDQQNNVPTAHFHTADDLSGTHAFPQHYTLYVLHAQDGAAGRWNHGETSGVGISVQTNEVIYWAESW